MEGACMRTFFTLMAGAAGMAMILGTLAAAPSLAASDYSVTVKGLKSGKTLKNLKPGATPTVTINNIPAGIGLSIRNCKVDAKSGQPTFCNQSKGSVVDVPAMADVRNVKEKIALKSSFSGYDFITKKTEQVDCEIPAPNNFGANCALYVFQSQSATPDPAYTAYFFTSFKNAAKNNDVATVKLNGKTIGNGAQPKLKYEAINKIRVALKSGMAPKISVSPDCSYDKDQGTLIAKASSETCTMLISSAGNSKYGPLTRTQVFTLVVNK